MKRNDLADQLAELFVQYIIIGNLNIVSLEIIDTIYTSNLDFQPVNICHHCG